MFLYGLRFLNFSADNDDIYAFVQIKQSGETTLYEKLNVESIVYPFQFFLFH